jgi:hypothetical protein
VEGDPGNVDRVGVGLDQHRQVRRQVVHRMMGDRAWPAEVETAELLHHRPPHLHPEQGMFLTVVVAAEQAQV